MWIERFLCTSACLHNLIVFILILWRNRNATELNKEHDLALPLFRVTAITIFSYVLQNLVAALSTMVQYFPDLLPCVTWYSLEFATYYLAKFFIWYYSITRLKIVFHDTPFLKYRSKTLTLITIMFLLTAIGLAIFTISTTHIFDLIPANDIFCTYVAPIWFTGTVGIFDSVMGILCYWLFYRKMSILTSILHQKQEQLSTNPSPVTRTRTLSEAEQRCDYELAYILRKYAILSFCTLISTWIAAGFATFSEAPMGLFSIDTVINTWCILLYDSRYDHIYNKIFKCISKSQWKTKVTISIWKYKKDESKSGQAKSVDTNATPETTMTGMTMTVPTISPDSVGTDNDNGDGDIEINVVSKKLERIDSSSLYRKIDCKEGTSEMD